MLACAGHGCTEDDCVDLTEREYLVCDTICKAEHPVSFSELKRTLDLHQEILSRTVRRLIIHGLVKKEDDGYACECGQ